MDKFTFWYIFFAVIACLGIIAVGIAADMQEDKESDFCESKGMTFIRGNHVQCITEDGDIKHFSKDKVNEWFALGEKGVAQ